MTTKVATHSSLPPSSPFNAEIQKDFKALKDAASRGNINEILALESKIQGTIATAVLLAKEGAIQEGPQFQKELNEVQAKTSAIVELARFDAGLQARIASINDAKDAVKISDEIREKRLELELKKANFSPTDRDCFVLYQACLLDRKDLMLERLDALSALETIQAAISLDSGDSEKLKAYLKPISDLKARSKNYPDIRQQLEALEKRCNPDAKFFSELSKIQTQIAADLDDPSQLKECLAALAQLKARTQNSEIQKQCAELEALCNAVLSTAESTDSFSALLSAFGAAANSLLSMFSSTPSNEKLERLKQQAQQIGNSPEKLAEAWKNVSAISLEAKLNGDKKLSSSIQKFTEQLNELTQKIQLTQAAPMTLQSNLPPVGLGNLACNCWANSILQLLANTPSLWPKTQDIAGLRSYFAAQQKGEAGSALIAQKLRSSLELVSQKPWVQEDPADALNAILDSTNSSLAFEQTVTRAGGKISKTTQSQPMLQVHLTGEKNLGKLIKGHAGRVEAEGIYKQMLLKTAPEQFMVQALRFIRQNGETGPQIKLSTALEVPSNYALGASETADRKGANYALTGCIIHLGATTSSGHYVSVVKKPDGWYLCNDSAVKKIDPAEANKWFSQGYIFQYSKIN